ncbi:alginate O-acetyltransferase AlgX-related protein [Pseudaestuariivita atlantica]|uniref:AlgX/AlgJ SGNH hydrolase-like domain-containing protein n=1 Tax=Pseudaestuariivita atlantica TaxID=1317121 RepID=A0A0L1JMW0_9RHOB|nr:hypothetical protein [Pseudaestuariivita atlantica]KNG93091.1 hypothetical protein ATO11_14370 [Pseudaestuariivita atlantica]
MPILPTLNAHVFAASFIGLTLTPGAWTIANVPLDELTADVISGKAQRLYEERFDASFPMRDTLRQSWAAVKYGALGELAEGAVAGRDGVLFTAEEFAAPADSRDFASELRAVTSRVRKAGAELIPVIVPDKARMRGDVLPRARSARFNARYDHLLTIIAEAGLRSVDLRPALTGPQAFMATDTHWSPEGAAAVADRIGALLEGEIAATATFETAQIGTRAFDGDLLAFVDTGVWRPLVGPAPEVIATYETTQAGDAGMDLFGDAETPVALVGTSYSARTDFHFTGFLKSALNADVISFAMEGRGPFIPMDRFLDGDALSDLTPQIVLWEIPERYLDTWSQDQ